MNKQSYNWIMLGIFVIGAIVVAGAILNIIMMLLPIMVIAASIIFIVKYLKK